MKALLCSFALACIGASALGAAQIGQGQSTPLQPAKRAIRIKVRHADPWFIKAMLEGSQTTVMPELSTIFGLFGAPPQSAGQVNGLFSGGHFIVNPTDNSLWWYPD